MGTNEWSIELEFTRRGERDRGRRFILPVLSQTRNFTLILQLRE